MSSNKEGCPFLLVTANVGSIFEDPDGLLKIWIAEFLKTIENLQPLFIALHCQEVGGKNYETSMKHVKYFVKTLLDSEQLMPYSNVRVFLDEDFTHTENFTALGNLYFIHESLKDVKLFDFELKTFQSVIGREIFSGNIEDVTLKEKAKFPQQLFPECRWSRKGYLRTRWSCENFIFDLTNIHLFHDASNFIAMESFPSQYTVIRQDALQHVLDKFNNDDYESVPMFIFGDFNFRLDMRAVIERLTQDDINHSKGAKNGSSETISFKDPLVEDKTILTLGKKVFDLSDHDKTFLLEQNHKWLLDLDKEVKCFEDQLYEFEIGFPPSYPFTEEATCSSYMKTRCPAWCDRILLNKSAMDLIRDQSSDLLDEVKYDMIGKNVPMGDHKPILLSFKLLAPAGKWRSGLILFPRKDSTEHMHVDFLSRLRTYSIPSMRRPRLHFKARRTTSASTRHKPVFHDQDWSAKTQELFRSLRLCQSDRWSSRLQSHHSSSSEEWYADLSNVEEIASSTKTAESKSEKDPLNTDLSDNSRLESSSQHVGDKKSPPNLATVENRTSHSNDTPPGQLNSVGTQSGESSDTKSKYNDRKLKTSCDHEKCPCHCIVT